GVRAGRGCGNTPACAGTTWQMARSLWCEGEHPRVRGDDVGVEPHTLQQFGTPPRARGRPGTVVRGARFTRNTPACAGTTGAPTGWPARRPEHPRVRGDD